ncbi:MAG: site-2 protease family protein [Myxococcaceae bacterium]|nr:site-2 protease family protein [Myxococcaceae bacterium]
MAARGSSRSRERRSVLGGSVLVGRPFGIGVYVHITMLLLVAFIAIGPFVTGGAPAAIDAVLFVVAVFTTILLHELSHALVAQSFGYRTRSITLLPIGGIGALERVPERPVQELLVALSGPAVNFALAAILAVLLVLFGVPLGISNLGIEGGSIFARLMWANLMLGTFNLLPAFPMDGGRVLRALLSLRLPRERATEIAAATGKGIAVAFAVIGLFINPFLLLIAIFVWVGATGEAAQVQMQARLQGVTVRQAMATRFATLSPDEPLAEALEEVSSGFQHDFPVLDGEQAVGVLTRGDLFRGVRLAGPEAPVRTAMCTRFPTASPDEPIERVISRIEDPDCGLVMVMDQGRLVGLVTVEHLAELMRPPPAAPARRPRRAPA